MFLVISFVVLLGVLDAALLSFFLVRSHGKQLDMVDYTFWETGLASVWLVLIRTVSLLHGGSVAEKVADTDIGLILFYISLSAVASVLGSLCRLHAMEIGNKAIVNSITNSSLAFSTVFFIVFFHNQASAFTFVGILLIVVSVFLRSDIRGAQEGVGKLWLLLSIGSLVLGAATQILSMIPSQIGLHDALGLRSVSAMFLAALFTLILKLSGRHKTQPLAIKIALVTSLITTAVQLASYPLLDRLSVLNLTYLFTPLRLTVSVVVFSLFSSIYFRERMSKQQLIGLILCVVGIALFAL